jgi:putative lipoic acid-binding regulatory protein
MQEYRYKKVFKVGKISSTHLRNYEKSIVFVLESGEEKELMNFPDYYNIDFTDKYLVEYSKDSHKIVSKEELDSEFESIELTTAKASDRGTYQGIKVSIENIDKFYDMLDKDLDRIYVHENICTDRAKELFNIIKSLRELFAKTYKENKKDARYLIEERCKKDPVFFINMFAVMNDPRLEKIGVNSRFQPFVLTDREKQFCESAKIAKRELDEEILSNPSKYPV